MAPLRILLASGVFLSALAPVTVFAAETDFFGPIIPQEGDACYCLGSAMDWGCVLSIFQNVLNLVISLGLIAVVFFIAWAGFLLMTGGSNPGTRAKAKNRMLNAVVGLVLVFASMTVVDTLMKVIYNPETAFEGGTFGPWNSLLAQSDNHCLVVNKNPGVLNDVGLVNVPPSEGGTSGTPTTGGTGPGGPIPGTYTYDNSKGNDISLQKGDASAALTSVLTCISGKVSGPIRISSISDSKITSGQRSFAQCAASGQSAGCAHAPNSCHYGGRKCVGRSFAVDFGDETQAPVLRKAALACGGSAGFEGDHLHVSVGSSCGCN